MPLITPADLKGRYLRGLAASATGEDAWLEVLMSNAIEAIARYLGYAPPSAGASATLESTTYTGLRFDTYGGDHVSLPCGPITAIASVYDDPLRQFGADTLLASTDYEITPGTFDGIDLLPEGEWGAWSDTPKAGKVTCTAGYATLPASLKHAICLAVAHWYSLPDRLGQQSQNSGGATLSWRAEDLPVVVQQMLQPFMLTIQLTGGVGGE